jgi:hypothetical protein
MTINLEYNPYDLAGNIDLYTADIASRTPTVVGKEIIIEDIDVVFPDSIDESQKKVLVSELKTLLANDLESHLLEYNPTGIVSTFLDEKGLLTNG